MRLTGSLETTPNAGVGERIENWDGSVRAQSVAAHRRAKGRRMIVFRAGLVAVAALIGFFALKNLQ